MSDVLRFYQDQFHAPNYEPLDDSYSPLGSLLTSDVQYIDKWALDLLDGVVRVQEGATAQEGWEGNGWAGDIRPDGMHLQDLHSDDWRGDYSLALVRAVTLDYIRFLLPDPDERARALAAWETDEGRPHPARADL